MLLKIINCSSVLFSIRIVVNNKYNYNIEKGLILIILSFFFKLTDTYYIIDYNKLKLCSGTGWFHILSAFGLYFILNSC